MNAARKEVGVEAEAAAVDHGVVAEVEAVRFSLAQVDPEVTDLAMAHHFGTGCLVRIQTRQTSPTLPILPILPFSIIKVRMTAGRQLNRPEQAQSHGED